MAQLTIVADKTTMSETAAERITSQIERAIAARGGAAFSLTGGGTPDLLYQFLSDANRPWRGRIEWPHLHLFWGDEREVPPDHSESNFGLANRLLIQYVPVPSTQVHRIRGEFPAADAGRLYDVLLRARRDHVTGPLFDMMLLGIGENAHIASIFPGSPLLAGREAPRYNAEERLAAGVPVPEISQWRITMTPPALLDSAVIIVIAAGASKADAIAAALEGPTDIARYPAQLLRTVGERVEWIIDAAAAARLRAVPRA
jgi:6-phosphogluconolactonase